MAEAQPRDLQRYITSEGKIPFATWFDSLKDTQTKYRIDLRLNRLQLGNLGDYRSVGEGVCELKINYGPGYRIYFGQIGTTIILLLCGGDKSSQEKDIFLALEYWKDYKRRRKNAN